MLFPGRVKSKTKTLAGVWWGNNVRFGFYSIVSVLALPHVRHATLLHVLLHFHTYVTLRCWMCCFHFHTYIMLRCCMCSCTSTRHATLLDVPFHFHTCHATLLGVLLHFHTYVMLRCCVFSCIPRIRHATLLDVLLHFHTYVMLRCWMCSCTSTRTSCDAAGFPLTYVRLRCWMFSCTSTHIVMLRC